MISPWREHFPGIRALDAQGQVYLDSAATAQKPQAMIDALTACYAAGTANVHRAQYPLAEQVTTAFEASRQRVADWLGAASSQQILFTGNATEAINLLAYALEHEFRPGEQIVISALEHHANLLPWQQLCQRRQLELLVLPLDAGGHIDPDAAARLIGPRCRLLAVSQLSNVLGTWQPLDALIALARAQGALTVIDGAQGIVHARPDVQALDCDFYLFSAHKLYGPDGVGVLYGKAEALARLRHWQFGGEMVRQASFESARFHPAPWGFEAGTPAIAPVIALGASLDYLAGLDGEAVRRHEQALHRTLLDGLRARDGVRVLGEPDLALASFVVDGVHVADLAQLLAEQGVAVRAGSHCAQPLYARLGLSGALRVSLGLYNDGKDLERLFAALDSALEILR